MLFIQVLAGGERYHLQEQVPAETNTGINLIVLEIFTKYKENRVSIQGGRKHRAI